MRATGHLTAVSTCVYSCNTRQHVIRIYIFLLFKNAFTFAFAFLAWSAEVGMTVQSHLGSPLTLKRGRDMLKVARRGTCGRTAGVNMGMKLGDCA